MTLAPRPGAESAAGDGLLLVYDAWGRLTQVYEDTNDWLVLTRPPLAGLSCYFCVCKGDGNGLSTWAGLPSGLIAGDLPPGASS